jgi:hypothetical protein
MKNSFKLLLILITSLFLLQCGSNQEPIKQQVISKDILNFPVKVYFKDTITSLDSLRLINGFKFMNNEFIKADVQFTIDTIDTKPFPYLQDLTADKYGYYLDLSKQYDSKDTIFLWVINNDQNRICDISDVVISCSRTGGFAFIANSISNNIVMANFDLSNPHILTHEFGHFFGLYHTFEYQRFGREMPDDSVQITDPWNRIVETIPPNSNNCKEYGDKVCDTSPNSSTAFEIFVSYNECEMFYKDWKPMVNNIMSYYRPCINEPYTFTPGQIQRIKDIGVEFHKQKADTITVQY